MKGLPRLLVALGGAALFLAAVAAVVILGGWSLVVIENRGNAPVELSVESTHAGDFSWSGELGPDQRVVRVAEFTADGGIRAVCQDAGAIHRTRGGHVAAGWPHRVDVIAASCAQVRVEAGRVP